MCLVSVIVPIYNVEKYLDTCILSISEQSYTNIEILLVDDGSTDQSGEICEKWRAKDKRIIVIHKKNGGLSDARNVGLNRARGKWILFVDGDDFVGIDMISTTVNTAQRTGADLVAFDFERVEEDNDDIQYGGKIISEEIYDGRALLYEFARTGKGYSIVCNKLYSKDIWNGMRFPLGKIHEDEFVIVNVLQKIKRATVIDTVLYYYRQRKGSIMSTVSLKSEYDALEAFEIRYNEFKNDKQLRQWGLNLYLEQIIKLYFMENSRKRQELLCLFRKKVKISLKYTKWKTCIRYILFCYSPDAYVKIVRLVK